MASNSRPTTEQLFGALNSLWKTIVREHSSSAPKVYPFSVRLGHEPAGEATTVGLGPEARSAYSDLLAKLDAATIRRRRGSAEQLQRTARRFLLEMACDNGEGYGEIRRRHRAAIEEIVGGKVQTWYAAVHAPVSLGALKDATLVGVRFQAMSDEGRQRLLRQIRRHIAQPHKSDPVLPDWLGFKYLKGRDVVATLRVPECTLEGAEELARQLLEDRVDCLAGVAALLRRPTVADDDPRRSGMPGVVIDLATGSGKGTFAPLSTRSIDISDLVASRNVYPLRLLLRLIENPKGGGGSRLVSCLRWLGRSRRANTEAQAYVNASIALESLLHGDKKPGIGRGLGLRVAHLVGAGRAGKLAVIAIVDDLYDLRSRLVHGNIHDAELHQLLSLWTLLNRCILAFVKRRLHSMDESKIERWFLHRLL